MNKDLRAARLRMRYLLLASFLLSVSFNDAEAGSCLPSAPNARILAKTTSKHISFSSFRSLSYVDALAKSPLRRPDLEMQATIFQPSGEGPFPAVIINHGSGGVGSHHYEYAKRIVDSGMAAVLFDGFCPRGLQSTVGSQFSLGLAASIADNYALLNALQKEPFIDGANIGAMGTSRGGSALVLAADERMRARFQHGKVPFKSFAAVYPGCSTQLETKTPSSIRLLVQLGRQDTYFPPEQCRKVVGAMKTDGFFVRITEYAAHHGWDAGGPPTRLANEMSYGNCNMVVRSDGVPVEQTSNIRMDSMANSQGAFSACGVRGAYVEGNDSVRRESTREVIEFFSRELRPLPRGALNNLPSHKGVEIRTSQYSASDDKNNKTLIMAGAISRPGVRRRHDAKSAFSTHRAVSLMGLRAFTTRRPGLYLGLGHRGEPMYVQALVAKRVLLRR